MKIKIKRTVYDTEDIPICLLFANFYIKDGFIKELSKINHTDYFEARNLVGVLAGNTLHEKGKNKFYLQFDEVSKIRETQKILFNTGVNSIIYSPEDIYSEILMDWLEKFNPEIKKIFEKYCDSVKVLK